MTLAWRGGREDGGQLEIDQTKAPVGLAVGHVANVGVIMPDAEFFKFTEEFGAADVVEMLDARSAVRSDNLELLLICFKQPGSEGAALGLEMPQNTKCRGL